MLAINKERRTAEKIFRRVKKLRDQMQPEESPLLAVAAIWDSGKEDHSTPCEVIITTQRLLGYYVTRLSRKRVFLEEVALAEITNVTFRQKTFEPIFRELLICAGQRKVYIRAPRRYIEALFAALRSATEANVPATNATFEDEQEHARSEPRPVPSYGRQDIRTSFDRSPLAITLLFVGGLFLEVIGFVLWSATQSVQVGMPLFIAGLLAVLTATFIRRQRH